MKVGLFVAGVAVGAGLMLALVGHTLGDTSTAGAGYLAAGGGLVLAGLLR